MHEEPTGFPIGQFLVVLGLGTCFVVTFVLLLRYIIRYRISDSAIDVLLFGLLPIARARFDNIAEIGIRSPGEEVSKFLRPRSFFGELVRLKLGNRMTTRSVHIILKTGWLARHIVITPDDPYAFVKDVQHRFPEVPVASAGYNGRISETR